MSAAAPPPVRRRTPSGGPLLPRTVARLLAFIVLGAVGAISWGGMVLPARGWALLGFALVAAAAGVAARPDGKGADRPHAWRSPPGSSSAC